MEQETSWQEEKIDKLLKEKKKDRRIKIILIIIIILLFMLCFLGYRIGKIGYGEQETVANAEEAIAIIKVTQEDIEMTKDTRTKYF